jgi:phosphate/sulfate permease
VSRQQRPAPPPLEGDDRLITAVITAGWAIALVVMLIARNHLAAADRWWVWVPVAGFCLGLFGLGYVPHLKRSRARAAERQQQRAAGQADNAGNGLVPPAAGHDAGDN